MDYFITICRSSLVCLYTSKKLLSEMKKYKIIPTSYYLLIGLIVINVGCANLRGSKYGHWLFVSNMEKDHYSLFYGMPNRVIVHLDGIAFEDLVLQSDSSKIEKRKNYFLITPFCDRGTVIRCLVNGIVVDTFLEAIEYVPVTYLSIGRFDPHPNGDPQWEIIASSSISGEHYTVKSYDYRCITVDGEEFSGSMIGNDITDNERIKKELKPGFLLFLSNVQLEKQKGIYPDFRCESRFFLR